MTLIDVYLIILILAALTVSIFMIIFLKKILEQADAVRRDIHQLVENTLPVMNNLEEVTDRANRIVTEVEGYWNEIDGSIKNVRKGISIITSLKSFRAVGYPVKYLIKNLSAIKNGADAFLNVYKRKS